MVKLAFHNMAKNLIRKVFASPEIEEAMKKMKLEFGNQKHIQIVVQFRKIISLIAGKRSKDDIEFAEKHFLYLINQEQQAPERK